ncbi:hypothetical protein A2875_02355 [Candidatus Gottesmanbacteria bacterium RIFCSPHIGHO2_01_FULL_46_14]|uniref:Uncharacterized protein n=2 Tax=Candidatus Gottesmaniibacteriota TaxID=1752720 RepID=A0A1F5ZSK3_9BACT|nr:MAG: hypothetical protein A2875_02355 [Candidatus Gottesmanbacteria bacterium RIFCSPHIGHO2_01_FULL_46_14]OGG30091.1 MAG: hypothetical protein A2971_04470 [Candidatus Gottesmanbacteria bacterium RIFCSPLOWO2_01_FULL_46_21]
MSYIDNDRRLGVLGKIGARAHAFTDITETSDGFSLTISGGSKNKKKVELKVFPGERYNIKQWMEMHNADSKSLKRDPNDASLVDSNRKSDAQLPMEIQDHQG